MDKNQAINAGRSLFLFIIQIVILFFCIAYIEFVYYVNVLPDKQVKENYVQTSCLITQKNLAETGHFPHRYRANFLLSYQVSGRFYQAVATGNGLDQAYTTNRTAEEQTLAQYTVEQTYPCWYNPSQPQLVVLVLRHNWASTFPLVVPSIVAIITFYYLLRSIFMFLGVATVTAKDFKKRRIKKTKR